MDSTVYNVIVTLVNNDLISSVEIYKGQDLIRHITYQFMDSVVRKTDDGEEAIRKTWFYLNNEDLAYHSFDTTYYLENNDTTIYHSSFFYQNRLLMKKVDEGLTEESIDSVIIYYKYDHGNQLLDSVFLIDNGSVTAPWVWAYQPYYYNYLENFLKVDIVYFKIGILGKINKNFPSSRSSVTGRSFTGTTRLHYSFDMEGLVTKRIDTVYTYFPDSTSVRDIYYYKYIQ